MESGRCAKRESALVDVVSASTDPEAIGGRKTREAGLRLRAQGRCPRGPPPLPREAATVVPYGFLDKSVGVFRPRWPLVEEAPGGLARV